MTIISLKYDCRLPEGAVTLEFSDESKLLINTAYFPMEIDSSALLETGRELGASDEDSFRFAAACFRAEKGALRLVARAEQSSLGLTAKLERRGFDSEVARAVVNRLLDQKLLDDSRYAELWIRSRLRGRKALTPQLLLAGLGKRGIDKGSSRAALEKALDSEAEYALLLRYVRKSDSAAKTGKKMAFKRANLRYLGFSAEALDRYFDSE